MTWAQIIFQTVDSTLLVIVAFLVWRHTKNQNKHNGGNNHAV